MEGGGWELVMILETGRAPSVNSNKDKKGWKMSMFPRIDYNKEREKEKDPDG